MKFPQKTSDKDGENPVKGPEFDIMVDSDLAVHGGQDPFFEIRKPKVLHWSVAWSDLMMTMFILFLVMYLYQVSHREFLSDEGAEKSSVSETAKWESDAEQDKSRAPLQESISEIYKMSTRTIRAESLKEIASIDLVKDKAVRIILPGDLLFDTGKADMKPGAIDSLKKIAALIRKKPYIVNVVGHTDNIPIHSDKFATNWELSTIRACVVARYLIENMKIPSKRFYVTGHSYNMPVRPNDTQKNREANRRVEIILTKEKPYAVFKSGQNITGLINGLGVPETS